MPLFEAMSEAATFFSYAIVVAGNSPVTEYPPGYVHKDGVVSAVERADRTTARFSGDLGDKQVLILFDKGTNLAYGCVADKSVSVTNGWGFLEDLRSRWARVTGTSCNLPNPRFGQTEIAAMMRNYNSSHYAKIQTIKDNQRETQVQMTENLTLALQRGAGLDELSTKADTLKESAQTFHREATAIKRQMCCQKWRWYIIGITIAVVIIFAIVWMACGLKFSC
jgi:vesicle-associated membrane protein 7